MDFETININDMNEDELRTTLKQLLNYCIALKTDMKTINHLANTNRKEYFKKYRQTDTAKQKRKEYYLKNRAKILQKAKDRKQKRIKMT